MMVEFAGLPGSGKSYLAEALNCSLPAEGCRVSMPGLRLSRLPSVLRLPAKMYCSVALCLSSPAKAQAVWKAIGRPGKTGSVARMKLFIACALPLFWYGKQTDQDGILVLDQGSVQALASAAFRNDPANLEALATLLPAPDILVIVSAAEKDINSRLAAGRAGGASRAEDPAGRADFACALAWALAVIGGPAVQIGRAHV